MSVEVGTFLEKFKDAGIESTEIKIVDSPYYYIVQKEDEKAELIKVLKEIDTIEEYIKFENVSEIIYGKKV